MFKKFNESELIEHVEIESGRRAGRKLCCCQCLTLVTYVENRIQIGGAHRHTCTNPAKQTFDIGCFKHAPGCTHVGVPTSDHTWFNGYSWRIALCNQCKKHLGWAFIGTSDQFYGLILSEIIEMQ